MPLIPVLVAFLVLFVVVILALPISLVQRYRVGTSRRVARKWVATINLGAFALSSAIFLGAAALTNFWVPSSFVYSLLGLASGGVLGLIGLAITRWEETPQGLYFTPNRWLILFITTAVAARLLYSFWRGWEAWGTSGAGHSWLAAAGVAGSLAVGAAVIGYYLSYSIGLRRRIKR